MWNTLAENMKKPAFFTAKQPDNAVFYRKSGYIHTGFVDLSVDSVDYFRGVFAEYE